MLRQKVKSTPIWSIGYDSDFEILEIEFTSGKVYVYREVPKDVWLEFFDSVSKGSFYRENIRGLYESYKAETAP